MTTNTNPTNCEAPDLGRTIAAILYAERAAALARRAAHATHGPCHHCGETRELSPEGSENVGEPLCVVCWNGRDVRKVAWR